MKRKFGLQIKFTLLFLGFMLLITGTIILFLVNNNKVIIEESYRNYAISIGQLAAGMVTAEDVIRYQENLEPDEEYEQTLQELQQIQRKTNIYYLYVIYPISEDEGIYIYDVALEEGEAEIGEEETHKLGDFVHLGNGYKEAKAVMQSGTVSQRFEYDNNSENETPGIASVYVPIMKEGGTAVAFVGVDMDIRTILKSIYQATVRMMGTLMILMIFCFVLLMLLLRFSIINPVRRLKKYAERLSEGRFGGELPVRGHDEISEITSAFNRMSRNIQGHMEEIQTINRGYEKYVPLELLKILEKDSITQMELGNHASRFVTLLSFQLREAGSDMMKRDNQQILEDMNFLFRTTIPLIMEKRGFVERFQDTGMLAVYTESVEAAVISAISICQKMNQYQNRKDKISPKFSMGITYGGVLFGNVGQEQRMATISISSHTSMARYLQKLAPVYGSKLLITSGAAEQIPEFSKTYHYRFIGMVENKYSQVVYKVYDIYDGDSDEQRDGKERTREQFEQGVELFCMHRFREGRQAFIEVLKRFRKDTGAKKYLQMCNQYYQLEQSDSASGFMQE